MTALALLLVVPLIMWSTQSVLLWRAGLPLQARINPRQLPRHLKRYNRAATQTAFGIVLLAYPLIRGQSPLSYYGDFFPLDGHPWELLHGFAAAVLYLALIYVAWIASGNIRFRVRDEPARLARRLAGVPVMAFLVAFVEELLFRAMLLADLVNDLPLVAAVAVGAAVFAVAHYVRSVKRYWTFGGHLVLGLLLCIAFVCTQSLWLPIGIHAAGVVMLMGTRPFIRYDGPAWLVGASVFPYAGAVGIAALILLTCNIWSLYGGL